jgi:hypothetical protein
VRALPRVTVIVPMQMLISVRWYRSTGYADKMPPAGWRCIKVERRGGCFLYTYEIKD